MKQWLLLQAIGAVWFSLIWTPFRQTIPRSFSVNSIESEASEQPGSKEAQETPLEHDYGRESKAGRHEPSCSSRDQHHDQQSHAFQHRKQDKWLCDSFCSKHSLQQPFEKTLRLRVQKTLYLSIRITQVLFSQYSSLRRSR